MAFSSRRGRPKLHRPIKDGGTKELQKRRQLGLTSEPLDLCLERSLITPDQHWAGIHLRWLYTVNFGVPTPRSLDILTHENYSSTLTKDSEWYTNRQKEYNAALQALKTAQAIKTVKDICVFHRYPKFLLFHGVAVSPIQARKNAVQQRHFEQGLNALIKLWNCR